MLRLERVHTTRLISNIGHCWYHCRCPRLCGAASLSSEGYARAHKARLSPQHPCDITHQ